MEMNEEMPEPFQPEQPMYSMPPQQFAPVGVLDMQINVDEILMEVEHQLRGRQRQTDADGTVKWGKANPKHALINDEGVKVMLMQLRTRLSKIFIFSQFNEEQVEGMAKGYAAVNREMLFAHWDEWEIGAPANGGAITSFLHDVFFSTLLKGQNALQLKATTTMHQVQERASLAHQQQPQPQQQPPGIVRKIMGMGN